MTARIRDYVKYLIAERDDNGRVLLDVGTVKDLLAECDRLSTLAATHLADQEYMVARERKRVARECAEIAEVKGINQDCLGKPTSTYSYGRKVADGIADAIRAKYGVEE